MSRKRGNNEGSLYQRPGGKWVGQLSLPGDSRGKRRRKWVTGDSRKEVRDRMRDLEASIVTGGIGAANTLTVDDACKHWLEQIRPTVQFKTYQTYELVVRRHVQPFLGSLKLNAVTPDRLDTLYADLMAEGRSPATVAKAHRVLSTMFKYWLKRDYVNRNPVSVIKPPRVPKREKMMLSPKDASAFLKAANNHPLEALFVIAITTGARSGELLGLTWDCVDFKNQTIRIEKGMKRVEHGFELGETKNRASRRTVALSSLATNALVRHRQRQSHEASLAKLWQNTQNLVFTNSKGKRLEPNNVLNRALRPLLREAGLPDTIRFHDLRDIAASLAITQRPVTEVAAMLGHSSPATTLAVYAHALPGSGEHVAASMDMLLGESSEDASIGR